MDENDESLVFVTFWDCRTHVPMTSSVERTDLDFKISVALAHNICFYGEISKFIPKLSSNTLLICSTVKEPFCLHLLDYVCWNHTCSNFRIITAIVRVSVTEIVWVSVTAIVRVSVVVTVWLSVVFIVRVSVVFIVWVSEVFIVQVSVVFTVRLYVGFIVRVSVVFIVHVSVVFGSLW